MSAVRSSRSDYYWSNERADKPQGAKPSGATEPPASELPWPELRHRIGGQIGGSGYVQAIYRLRPVGPLHLEVGAGVVPITGAFIANMSAGIVVDVPVADRWSVYAGGGPGGGGIAGDGGGSTSIGFVHARLGFSFLLSPKRKDFFAIDGGFWRGTLSENRDPEPDRSRQFLWPRAGVAVYHAF